MPKQDIMARPRCGLAIFYLSEILYNIIMSIIVIFWRWYYGRAVKDVLAGWRNFVIFVSEYFSIPLLFKTLFSPWKRDITKKPRGLDFKKLFEYLTYNLISRGVGFFVRFVTILVGIIFLLLTAVAGAVFFIVWLVLPLIILGLFVMAIILIF